MKSSVNFRKKSNLLSKILVLTLSFSFFISPLNQVRAEPTADAAGAAAASIASCFAGGAIGGIMGGIASAVGLVVPVGDAGNTTVNTAKTNKECTLDGIANGLKRILVRSLVDSTVNWINGGFEGKPSFAANLSQIGLNIKDEVLNEIIYSNKRFAGLCTAFKSDVKLAVHLKFYGGEENNYRYTPKCTIEDIVDNLKDAGKDLENFYSWNNFLAVMTDGTNNNPFGVYFKLVSDAEKEINKRESRFARELRQNSGFLSMRRCNNSQELMLYWQERQFIEGREDSDYGDEPYYDGSAITEKHCPIITPGTVLSEQLNKSLGLEMDSIIGADEFDEIIAALVGQLVTRLMNGGVSGFSSDKNSYRDGKKDPALNTYKKTYLKQFDTRAYDIAIKILNSRKRTVENARNVFNSALICWSDKKEEMEENDTVFYRDESAFSLRQEFVRLTETTVSTALTRLVPLEDRFKREIDKINGRIFKLKADRKKAEQVRELIVKAEDFLQLNNILAEAQIEGVDLNKERKEQEYTEKTFDEMVNGKVIKYNQNGAIKEGGIGVSQRYCSGFDITDTPSASALIEDSVNDPNTLKNKKDINIIDGYDPTDDIYNLENDDIDYDFEDEYEETSYICEDSNIIQCMGDLDTAFKSTEENISIDDTKVQVYTISPENRVVPRGKIKIANQGWKNIKLSLNKNPHMDSEDKRCREVVKSFESSIFRYNSENVSAFCDISPSETYFLRLETKGPSEYTLTTYGDGEDRGNSQDSSSGNSPNANTCVTKLPTLNCRTPALPSGGREMCNSAGGTGYVRTAIGRTEVWEISSKDIYTKSNIKYADFDFKYSNGILRVSISEYPDKDSASEFCTKDIASGTIYANNVKTFGQCHVDWNKKTYYLRVTSLDATEYCLFEPAFQR